MGHNRSLNVKSVFVWASYERMSCGASCLLLLHPLESQITLFMPKRSPEGHFPFYSSTKRFTEWRRAYTTVRSNGLPSVSGTLCTDDCIMTPHTTSTKESNVCQSFRLFKISLLQVLNSKQKILKPFEHLKNFLKAITALMKAPAETGGFWSYYISSHGPTIHTNHQLLSA